MNFFINKNEIFIYKKMYITCRKEDDLNFLIKSLETNSRECEEITLYGVIDAEKFITICDLINNNTNIKRLICLKLTPRGESAEKSKIRFFGIMAENKTIDYLGLADF